MTITEKCRSLAVSEMSGRKMQLIAARYLVLAMEDAESNQKDEDYFHIQESINIFLHRNNGIYDGIDLRNTANYPINLNLY